MAPAAASGGAATLDAAERGPPDVRENLPLAVHRPELVAAVRVLRALWLSPHPQTQREIVAALGDSQLEDVQRFLWHADGALRNDELERQAFPDDEEMDAHNPARGS